MSGMLRVMSSEKLFAHRGNDLVTVYDRQSHDDDDYASYCYGFVYDVMIYMVDQWHL